MSTYQVAKFCRDCLVDLELRTLAVEDPEAALDRIRSLPRACALVEIRADRLRPGDVREVVREARRPVLVTARRACDGGLFTGSESERRTLLDSALTLWFEPLPSPRGRGSSFSCLRAKLPCCRCYGASVPRTPSGERSLLFVERQHVPLAPDERRHVDPLRRLTHPKPPEWRHDALDGPAPQGREHHRDDEHEEQGQHHR